MDDRQAEVGKALDAVVGDAYKPPRRWGATLLKWVAGAAAGVAMAAIVVGVLDRHITRAQKDSAAKRPVPIMIIPAR